MTYIQKLLEADNTNTRKVQEGLIKFFPDSLNLVEKFVQTFENLGVLWGKVCEFDKHQKELLKWAKKFGINPNAA